MTQPVAQILFATTLALLLTAVRAEESEPPGKRLKRVADPVDLLLQAPLTPANDERLNALFRKLDADDFDERQRAEREILAFGPRAIQAAQSHLTDKSLEARDFAKRFNTEILLHYQGYLPVSADLRAKLLLPHRYFIGKNETLREAVQRAFRDSEISAAFRMTAFPDRTVGTQETTEFTLPAGEGIDKLLTMVALHAVPRGDGLVVVPLEEADATAFKQEHVFRVGAEARAQLVTLLSAWLPQGATVEATNDGVRVTGTEIDLRLAARALFCLAPTELTVPPPSSEATFPPSSDSAQLATLLNVLNKPVKDFKCGGTVLATAIARLREEGHPLAYENQCGPTHDYEGGIFVHLSNVPLGVALQWLIWRAENLGGSENTRASLRIDAEEFFATPAPKDRPHGPLLYARKVCSTIPQASAETVHCTDVNFLFEKPNGPQKDADAAREIQRVLSSELSILPHATEDFAVAVLNKRALLRGSGQAIALARKSLESWRSTGTEPKPAWREKIDDALSKEYDWDGRGLSPGGLIPRLREMAGINLMLEVPSGKALELKTTDAPLLPPGKQTLRALLDRLANVANATWNVKAGAIVVAPKPDEPPHK